MNIEERADDVDNFFLKQLYFSSHLVLGDIKSERIDILISSLICPKIKVHVHMTSFLPLEIYFDILSTKSIIRCTT